MLLFPIRSCQSSICVEDPERPSTSLDVIENKIECMQQILEVSSLSIRKTWSQPSSAVENHRTRAEPHQHRPTIRDEHGRSEPELHQQLCYRLHVLPHLSRSCLGRLASDKMLLGSRMRCSCLACKPMRRLRDHSLQR
ncbi:hypothetical protein SISNIDRAFT_461664 [Sistotremastrum niveocremeum HHB9708]|uniref:Uncharacterized protein n=1 Tax=Sistotremastrum niveocremeum HHB9708 TaxID=1314777 RepID=A0A164MAC9_9AGAM|nr:hypothetical protein SISNIDRAFT_461664 [Sistotremastrum niveocremeum HHB9708]